jgi:hypothetical protein
MVTVAVKVSSVAVVWIPKGSPEGEVPATHVPSRKTFSTATCQYVG